MTAYDSRPDTHEHIAQVRGLVLGAVADLLERAHRHDRSKLVDPELSMFDIYRPKLDEAEHDSQGDDVRPYIDGGGMERFGYGEEVRRLLQNTVAAIERREVPA